MRSLLSFSSKAALAFGLMILSSPSSFAEPLRLVALGDSLTQGYGLPQGEGLVPQLQSWLSEQGHDVVINNAGVSGDTSAGGLSRLDWTLAEPTDAMMVMLGGNDMLRGIDPQVTRSNIDQILTKAAEKDVPVLLMTMEAPSNYGPDYQQAFDAIFPELAQKHGVLLGSSYLEPLKDVLTDPSAMQIYMQPDAIHPSREGVAKIVPFLGPQVVQLLERAQQKDQPAE